MAAQTQPTVAGQASVAEMEDACDRRGGGVDQKGRQRTEDAVDGRVEQSRLRAIEQSGYPRSHSLRANFARLVRPEPRFSQWPLLFRPVDLPSPQSPRPPLPMRHLPFAALSRSPRLELGGGSLRRTAWRWPALTTTRDESSPSESDEQLSCSSIVHQSAASAPLQSDPRCAAKSNSVSALRSRARAPTHSSPSVCTMLAEKENCPSSADAHALGQSQSI
eukprot:2496255-Pleurochrysis_carterae.AAC.1